MTKPSFSVSVSPVVLEDGSVMAATVTLHLGGGQSIAGSIERPLDAAELLARETSQGTFDLLTCSCGVAGCAGIFDEVVLQSDEQTVRFQFPEHPYRMLLGGEAGDLSVVFSRGDYLTALGGLEQELRGLESIHGRLALPPLGTVESVKEVPTVDRLLARMRQGQREHDEAEACFRDSFGELAGRELVVRQGSLTGRLSVRGFARAVAQSADASASVERRQAWKTAAAQLSRSPANALRSFAVDWRDWFEWKDSEGAYADAPDLTGAEAAQLWVSAEWASRQ